MRSKALLSVLLAGLLAASLLAAPVAAVESAPQDAPEESEVDTGFNATYELTDLFADFEQWSLVGETELRSVTWTVTQYDQAGNQVRQDSFDGQTFSQTVDIESGVSRIEVSVTGTTPGFETPNYDPPQRFTAATFELNRRGGTQQDVATYETHHYTRQSRSTRGDIESAEDVVESDGGDRSRETLQRAISAYEAGNYDNANQLADRAVNEAQRNQRVQSTLLVGGGAVVVIVLLVGGYVLYQRRKQDPDRLR
jgi:TolA-binding protein